MKEKKIPGVNSPKYRTQTGYFCSLHGASDKGECCRRAALMTPKQHDEEFDKKLKEIREKLKHIPFSERAVPLLEEARKSRIGPRLATCKGKFCAGREELQVVLMPCVACGRMIK